MEHAAALVDAIAREIAGAGGAIPFERFMELALYHPHHGYYTRPEVREGRPPRIGRQGDYFTSVSVGPLFGRILARQFRQFQEALGNTPDFEVVEFGGHGGQLRADVRAAAPDLVYRVIEVGDSCPESIVGCVFANEFLDALPVHRVRVVNGRWEEIYVARSSPVGQAHRLPSDETRQAERLPYNFQETLGPLSDPRLADFLGDLPVEQMEGYRTEVNLRALDWLEKVARCLRRGWVIVIDYGYDRAGYFAPQHADGTLLCYHRHTRNDQPLARVGDQDITAHVEFTSLRECGQRLGLEPVRFTDQSHYLLETGAEEIAEIVERTAGRLSRERAAIHQLIHPERMGRAFQVLILRKG